MANNKDFKVKNGIQPTVYHEAVGTVTSGSVGYSLSAASYDSVSLSVTSQIGTPTGIFFKPDGTKVFIVDLTGQDISEYSLSTAWDLTTASYVTAFSIASQDTNPWGLFFKSDGTVLYLMGRANDTVYQYTLSTAWDISTASYASKSFTLTSQDTLPNDLFLKSDGTKMYVLGGTNDTVYQYTLSTAYDVSTASYDSVSFSLTSQTTAALGLFFHPDGTSFYIIASGRSAYEYTLSTAWDLSTTSYSSISATWSDPPSTATYTLAFKSDGTKMYVVEGNTDSVYQFSTVLTTNTLDLSTGSVFEVTPTSDIQINLSNPADSGTVSQATLLLAASGTAHTITYPSTVEWPSGTAPTSPAIGETDIIAFSTSDGGTSYKGVLAIDGAK